MDNRTWNAINSMNNMKSSFAPKKEQELWQREGEHEQSQEYDEIFVRIYHFTERYLDKLVNEQCHKNAK